MQIPEAIKNSPNIHVLGLKPYEELPDYLKGIDVAILPRVRNKHTDHQNPLKIWEYLSAGRPVVSIDLLQVQPLTNIVFVASNKEQFLSCIDQALTGDQSLRVQKGIALAREHSWLELTKKVPDILAEVVSVHKHK